MKEVVIIGAGNIGSFAAQWLGSTGDYHVTLIDRLKTAFEQKKPSKGVTNLVLDIHKAEDLTPVLMGKFAVLSAAPFFMTTRIAEAAKAAECHYLDLTEDVASTELVRKLSKDANIAFIPQCGLAPGFISIVAYDMAKSFDTLDTVRMGVGALPKFPSNRLNYNMTWSTDGVINEYCEPCDAIVNGRLTKTAPLEERDEFLIDGVLYEAFNTSGGLGTLCETLDGKVKNLSYKTIRYPGHAEAMKLLLHDLKLRDRRHILKDLLETAVPKTTQDVVIVFVTVSGTKDGRLVQETHVTKVYNAKVDDEMHSAIQITTAAGLCTVLDMLADNKLPKKGFIKQEDIGLSDFLANRFGKAYAQSLF
jgi:saccharopine dehydrogenase-like NADP-dependent oxidoreductase